MTDTTTPAPEPGRSQSPARVTDLAALLDDLDQLRAAATPGEWVNDSHEIYQAVPGLPEAVNAGDWIGETCRVDDPRSDADAALIVAAVNAVPQLTTALRAVLGLHVPWYEAGGVRHDNTVRVGCNQNADCDGTGDLWCAESDGDGHEVLACYECRCVVDYDLDGFLLWPCPTAKAIRAALGGDR